MGTEPVTTYLLLGAMTLAFLIQQGWFDTRVTFWLLFRAALTVLLWPVLAVMWYKDKWRR